MHWYLWLAIGMLVGLVAQPVMGGASYGVQADITLGVVGAFLASWIIRVPNIDTRISWAGKSSLLIWSAALLPLLSRVVAKHRAARQAPPLRRPVSIGSQSAFLPQGAAHRPIPPDQWMYVPPALSAQSENRQHSQPF